MEHLNVTNIIITSQIYHTFKKKGKAKNSCGAYFAKNNLNEIYKCFSHAASSNVCLWGVGLRHTHTRSFMMQLDLKLNLITPVSWESADVPKSLKFTSNKNPRMQATCCCSNKTTASRYRSHRYFFEALLTSQPNISIDRDNASPTSL